MGKILIVDPSPIDRKRIRNILEAAGHSMMEMASPTEAMHELLNLPRGAVKLILTEMRFPDTTGLEFIHWLKRQGWLPYLPVLVVTEQPPREAVIEMVVAGASTIIGKPFGADLLLRRVTETLHEAEISRQGEGDSLTWPIGDFLRRELKRAERNGADFSIVVCRVLDQLEGRAVPALMGCLLKIMRESDIWARMGDDQVVVLLPDTDMVGASVVEARIWKIVQNLAEQPDKPFKLDVATGIATFPSEAADGETMVALARERCFSSLPNS
ncbi:MAG TPA: response regulator [Symbiobacteriaceae bacterium]